MYESQICSLLKFNPLFLAIFNNLQKLINQFKKRTILLQQLGSRSKREHSN